MPPSPEKLMAAFAANTAMFAAVALVFWGIEAAWRRFRGGWGTRFPADGRMDLGGALWFAFRHVPWMLAAAIGLSAAATFAARRLGLDLPQQDMLQWLAGDAYSAKVKAAIILFATVEAPLLEEVVFRRFLFRAFLRAMPLGAAIVLSGCVFALVHANALVFVPLAFLGGAFAWIYWRTGRLAASMFAHFLFNAANVALLLAFPELA